MDVPLVDLRSRSMLPRFTDEQLTELAQRVGLTLEQLRKIHNIANETYQYIAPDLDGGPHKRADLVDVVMDASYMINSGSRHLTPDIYEWLSTKSIKYPLSHVYQAVGAGFPYPLYE